VRLWLLNTSADDFVRLAFEDITMHLIGMRGSAPASTPRPMFGVQLDLPAVGGGPQCHAVDFARGLGAHVVVEHVV
jgi:hypothetical protein